MTDEPPLDRPATGGADRTPQLPPSHVMPRTRDGWIATLAYVVLFLIAMPPVTHVLLDRPETWVAGVPLLFAALLLVYSGLVVVLVWALRRGV
jgi:hypothetical protein